LADHLRGNRGRPGARYQFHRLPHRFEDDPETKAVMMIGEIGGSEEERAAEWIKLNMTKPLSRTSRASPRRRDAKWVTPGHHLGLEGTAQAKMDALREAGVHVCQNPTEAGEKMVEIVKAL